MAAKFFESIATFVTENSKTLTNLVLTGVTVGLNVLLNSELFDCPLEKYKTYGLLFLIAPCIILIFANMLVIVVDWNPFHLCSKPPENYDDGLRRCFKETLPSVTRVLVAPVVWLIVSFAEADYYVCAKVGPGAEKRNLTTNETEALNGRLAETKTESQIIAWALFIVLVVGSFLVICLENICGKADKCRIVPDNAVGMQDGRIPDEDITASSKLDEQHSASNARLNSLGAWVPAADDKNPWLQVDLGKVMKITKIATQGFNVGGVERYVGTYSISFSDDGESFKPCKPTDNGTPKVFEGNSDANTTAISCANFCARYCRLQPRTWEEQFALRMELFSTSNQ